MKLKTKIKFLSIYNGKSKFAFWNNIKINSIAIISMQLKPTGSNRGKIYAPSIKIEIENESFEDTINSFQKYLNKIVYIEIE